MYPEPTIPTPLPLTQFVLPARMLTDLNFNRTETTSSVAVPGPETAFHSALPPPHHILLPLPFNTGTTVAHFGHRWQCHTQLVTAVLDGAWNALRR